MLSSIPGNAQKYDFIWPLGYITPNTTYTDSIWGISFLNFDSPNGNPTISRNTQMIIVLDGTNASLCDKNGNFLFIFDGYRILDGGNNPMQNGSQLCNTQSNIFQNGIFLPKPGNDFAYYLLHKDLQYFTATSSVAGSKLLYSEIVFPQSGGFGSVTSKRNIVFEDTITLGKITTVRHANGRDWWILVKKIQSNRFFVFIADPQGVHFDHVQHIGPIDDYDGWGQAVFSPDGSKYCSINGSKFVDSTTYANLFDFDRCTGILNNYRQFRLPLVTFGAGAAFSPNNRFLYLPLWKSLYQIDLESQSPDTTLIDTWDGFLYQYPGSATWFLPSTYGPMVNGPDGRIYSVNYNDGFKYLNLIERPNLPAPFCQPQQHALEMPTLTGGQPNFANYRLGPVDGSACDSLGIDNIPWAWWRYEQDTALYGTIYFTDLSAYEPTHWHWDFGDGAMSQDTSPVHAYTAPGVYTVCLVVSNAYGDDTLCRTIYIATVPAPEPAGAAVELSVSPNPFRDRLNLQWSGAYLPERALCRLYDMTGRPVAEQRVYPGWNSLELTGLPAGVYVWSVSDGTLKMGNGKVVKVE